MDERSMSDYIINTFADIQITENFGYTFFFYGENRRLAFATLSSADNEYDRISNLDRPGVFRLNIGVSKQTFARLFGDSHKEYDFTALDVIMPHPEYAAQSFVCVLNPSEQTFQTVKELLAEAYEIAVNRHNRQNADKQS